MRAESEIKEEITKVNTAKRNAERKRTRCTKRLAELRKELQECRENEKASANAAEADV